jgi:hypothetical protein
LDGSANDLPQRSRITKFTSGEGISWSMRRRGIASPLYLRADEKSRAERLHFGLERDRYAIARRAARNIVGIPRCPA